MENNTNNSLKSRVLTLIEKGQTKMKPRWHFILKTLLFVLGVVIVFLITLYIGSFALFILDESDLWSIPSFGLDGAYIFVKSLPWFLIVMVLGFLFILQVLVRRYAFAYQRPLVFSAIFIAVVVVGGSLFLRSLGVHKGILEYSQHHRTPVAYPLYEKFGHRKNQQIHPGMIIEIHEKDFMLQNRFEEVYTVVVTPYTKFPRGAKFVLGDEVIVIGNKKNNKIEALGMRKIEQKRMPKRPMPDMLPGQPLFIEFVH